MKIFGCPNSRIALEITSITGDIWDKEDILNYLESFDMNADDINNYSPNNNVKEIYLGDEKVALCCQTPEMRKMWEYFGDTLVMDSTFKTTESS